MSSSEIVEPKIAYVEIEPEIREIIIRGLQKHGFAVAGYSSAESFLSDFRAGVFDLIMSNLKLPKMRGFDLYRYVKGIDPQQKFMFLTAFEIFHDELEKSGINCSVLRLPIGVTDLANEINKTLGLSPSKQGNTLHL